MSKKIIFLVFYKHIYLVCYEPNVKVSEMKIILSNQISWQIGSVASKNYVGAYFYNNNLADRMFNYLQKVIFGLSSLLVVKFYLWEIGDHHNCYLFSRIILDLKIRKILFSEHYPHNHLRCSEMQQYSIIRTTRFEFAYSPTNFYIDFVGY
jgi:hypothetical protein